MNMPKMPLTGKRPRSNACVPLTKREQGSLVVALVMLIAVLMLGVSASQIAMQGERMSRNERDRYIALEAAEAALNDAMLDIEGGAEVGRSRSHIFSAKQRTGFPAPEEPICTESASGMFAGLCRADESDDSQAWKLVDFDAQGEATAYVTYGQFTGQAMQSGRGSLTSKLPRYIIELLRDRRPGQSAEDVHYYYRITAVGFGARESTQVALQRFYYKVEQ